MRSSRSRVYADTSVFGGAFDPEFAVASRRFFDRVRRGELTLVIGNAVEDELEGSPPEVRELHEEMLEYAEVTEVPREAFGLQAAYIASGVVTERWGTDALHVATATVMDCAIIVSWNFRHIVNYRRIPLYNAVNTLEGYGEIAIYSPLELTNDDN